MGLERKQLISIERIGVDMKKKKYRVNESEHFNLLSMYEHLKVLESETPRDYYTKAQWSDLYKRLENIENLMEKAYCVGALVDWETLKAIREIQKERQLIRYACCVAAGDNEKEAAIALTL